MHSRKTGGVHCSDHSWLTQPRVDGARNDVGFRTVESLSRWKHARVRVNVLRGFCADDDGKSHKAILVTDSRLVSKRVA